MLVSKGHKDLKDLLVTPEHLAHLDSRVHKDKEVT